jgi:hypothetical protein
MATASLKADGVAKKRKECFLLFFFPFTIEELEK